MASPPRSPSRGTAALLCLLLVLLAWSLRGRPRPADPVDSAVLLVPLENIGESPPPAKQESTAAVADRDPRLQWFNEARFGMFIHFGLYAILGGSWRGVQTDGSACGDKATEDLKTHICGYSEWIRANAHIPVVEYRKLASQWDPVNFNPKAIASLAKEAGMRYVVLTTKHHEGFALWPSKVPGAWSVLDAKNQRNLVRELADEVRKAGLKMGLYMSIMDWNHDLYVPRRPWEISRPRTVENLTEGYVQFMHAQLRELLTDMGEIAVVWFDGEWEKTWNHDLAVATYNLCRELNPRVLVNNRVDVFRKGFMGFSVKPQQLGDDVVPVGDFGTPEQNIPNTGMGNVTWEACLTMNQNWGYHKNDRKYKSPNTLIRALVKSASKGGNLLLNIGPKPDGSLPTEAVIRLKRVGEWMAVHSQSIVGTRANPIPQNIKCCKITAKDGPKGIILYVFVYRRDIIQQGGGWALIPGTLNEPRRATLMCAEGGKNLEVERRINLIAIRVGDDLTGERDSVPVIKLELEGALEPVLKGDED